MNVLIVKKKKSPPNLARCLQPANIPSFWKKSVGSVKPVAIGSINMGALLSNLLADLLPARAHPPARALELFSIA